MRRDPERSAPAKQDGARVDPSQEAMAIPAAFTEARDKLQRTRQQGDRATEGVQRKRRAPLPEVVQFRWKRHVRQQVTKRPQRVYKDEEPEQEPQELGQESHVGLFWHLFSRCAAPSRLRVPAAKNQTSIGIDAAVLPQFCVSLVVQLLDLRNSSERVPRHASQAEQRATDLLRLPRPSLGASRPNLLRNLKHFAVPPPGKKKTGQSYPRYGPFAVAALAFR
jgi:hypothetical protein